MKLLTLLALIISASAFTVAQERAIDKAEFEAAVNGTDAHKIKWAGQSYRIEVTSSAKMLNRPDSDHSGQIIVEFGPARSRQSLVTNTHGSGKTMSSETLVLGDSLYKRENGGPWSVTAKPIAGSADNSANTDSAPRKVLSSDITYFIMGSERYREGTATLYRTIEKTREADAATGEESESVRTNMYWIVDGMQRRHVLRSQNRYPKFESINITATEWNLDPTIKFTPPPIGAGKQD